MAAETVHSRRPVREFFNDANPRIEGGVVFVVAGSRDTAIPDVRTRFIIGMAGKPDSGGGAARKTDPEMRTGNENEIGRP